MIQSETGALSCSGDRLKAWKDEIMKFNTLSIEEQREYLSSLDNPDRFLELALNINSIDCGFSSKLNHVLPDHNTRIPDPMQVGRLERMLKRQLTEEELTEGYIFLVDGSITKLTFINFPEDV
jgi:hypothetical protein